MSARKIDVARFHALTRLLRLDDRRHTYLEAGEVGKAAVLAERIDETAAELADLTALAHGEAA